VALEGRSHSTPEVSREREARLRIRWELACNACALPHESAHGAEGARRATAAEELQGGDLVLGNGEDLDGKRSQRQRVGEGMLRVERQECIGMDCGRGPCT